MIGVVAKSVSALALRWRRAAFPGLLPCAFCFLPSRPGGFGVALGSHWGGFRVALGWLWGGFGVPIGWLSTRFEVALMSHCGGNQSVPGGEHSRRLIP